MPAWPLPSERVRDLIRQGAELALAAPPEWFDEIDDATLANDHLAVVGTDPVLEAATRRTNRANLLHWAASNVANPGAPVLANIGPAIGVARDLVRRGVGEFALHAYRTGQNAAWHRWMAIAFNLTSDPDELRELLDVSARSIFSFVEVTIAAISAQMKEELEELTRGTHAERREVVSLLLDGAPITTASASHRLSYDLEGHHRAAVVWSDVESELPELEQAAEALGNVLGAPRSLAVVATAATLWVWLPSARELDRDHLRMVLPKTQVRIAVGSRGYGVEGFRRSHFDAVTTQRMLTRVGSSVRVATFDEVRLASLVTNDADAAREFVTSTLGELASAPAELRDALRTFLAEGCNASQAAKRLITHRNTLMRRLERAEALLPRPLNGARTEVAVALDVLSWQAPV